MPRFIFFPFQFLRNADARTGSPLQKYFLSALLCSGLVLQSRAAIAQTGDFEIAESFYFTGNFAKSAELFEKLYQRDSKSPLVLERLRMSLFQLRAFDKLIALLEKELSKKPDAALKLQLGQAYYGKGDAAQGDRVMESLCNETPSPNVFTAVVNALEQLKNYDRIPKFVALARQKQGDDRVMVRQLATAYLFLNRYGDATTEYLKLLRQDFPDMNSVQSSILSYATKSEPEALKQTIAAIQRARGSYQGNARGLLSQLLSALYVEAGNYAGALEEAMLLDKQSQAQGGQLLYFAQTALGQKQYAVAGEAYKKIIAESINRYNVQRAKLGLARTLDAEARHEGISTTSTSAESRTKRTALAKSALAAYKDYEATYSGANDLADALYASATLQRDLLNDADAARATLATLRLRFPAAPQAQSAQLMEAQFSLEQENLPGATAALNLLLRDARALPETRNSAQLMLGQLKLYESNGGNADSALQLLSAVEINSNAGNDAIELKLLITEGLGDTVKNPQASVAFNLFLTAHRFGAAKQPVKSIETFAAFLQTYPKSPLADDALSRKAAQEELVEPASAVITHERVVAEFPKSFYADKSLFRLGDLAETTLKDKSKAMAYYERLLADYPRSLYAADARKRLRALRAAS